MDNVVLVSAISTVVSELLGCKIKTVRSQLKPFCS